jgi:hypothetical protein
VRLLNYNDGVRRCGAHYTDGPWGCKPLSEKNLKKFKPLIDRSKQASNRPAQAGLSKVEISGFNTAMPN